jgi:cytoskeletal protein CcmA (bactofilin family)
MTQKRFTSSAAPSSGTHLGAGLVIEGEVSGTEPVTISGELRGTLSVTAAVTVGEGATVEADVEATTLEVAGGLVGNVVASERVSITESGRLIGDVRSPRISIAEGAAFKGHIDMDA